MICTDNTGWAAAQKVFGDSVRHLLCSWHVCTGELLIFAQQSVVSNFYTYIEHIRAPKRSCSGISSGAILYDWLFGRGRESINF